MSKRKSNCPIARYIPVPGEVVGNMNAVKKINYCDGVVYRTSSKNKFNEQRRALLFLLRRYDGSKKNGKYPIPYTNYFGPVFDMHMFAGIDDNAFVSSFVRNILPLVGDNGCLYDFDDDDSGELITSQAMLREKLGYETASTMSKWMKKAIEYNLLRQCYIPFVIPSKKTTYVSAFAINPLVYYCSGISLEVWVAFRDYLVFCMIDESDVETCDLYALKYYMLYDDVKKHPYQDFIDWGRNKYRDKLQRFFEFKEEMRMSLSESKIWLPKKSQSIDNKWSGKEMMRMFVDKVHDGNLHLTFKNYTSLIKDPFKLTQTGLVNLFYSVQETKKEAVMHSNSSVNTDKIKYLTLDIDIKKDGSSIPDSDIETLETIKTELIRDVIGYLPQPGAVTVTRNGIQVIWKLRNPVSQDRWEYLQSIISNTLGDLVDNNAVKLGGILRYPGPLHKKEGTDTYPTSLYYVSDVSWKDSSFEKAFSCVSNNERAIVFLNKYKKYFKENVAKNAAVSSHNKIKCSARIIELSNKVGTIRLYNVTDDDRFASIAMLDPDINLDSPRIMNSMNEARDYILQQPLSEFLNMSPDSNLCIFHNDGSPSAMVNDYGAKNHTSSNYYCYAETCSVNNGSGWDIFNVVSYIAFGTPNHSSEQFREVFKYLCSYYNIEIAKQTKK